MVGDAALMVNPYDVEQLADTMGKVLTDEALRESLIKKGRMQVRNFNWYRVARNTLAVYYEVFNMPDGGPRGPRKFLPYGLWQELKEIEESNINPIRT